MKMSFSVGMMVAAMVLGIIASAVPAAQAQTFTVLHTFSTTGFDGSGPEGTLIQDSTGNLYGTTYFGGLFTNGVIFKLDTSDNETVLHSFQGPDGENPSSGLILDNSGNFYGPAEGGQNGGGVLFKLTPAGNETVFFNFGGCLDCLRPRDPQGALLRDPSGNLYGTTLDGGVKGNDLACTYGCGTVFKLDSGGALHTLYAFQGGTDGQWPFGPLLPGPAPGSFYGVALYGGDLNCAEEPTRGCGTVFSLTVTGRLTVLHTFTGGSDGGGPQPGLVADREGNLYGAAQIGGNNNCQLGCGILYELGRSGEFTVLYSFTGGDDGNYPNGGLVLDSEGNLYGTTETGTTGAFYGTVYKLNTARQMTVLHSLNGDTDGAVPTGGLIRDSSGNLYGVAFTGYGRLDRHGTVFKVTP